MDLKQVLAINVQTAHDSFQKTIADMTQDMADWLPPGVMHPLGERYAHLVMAEDMLINGMAQGGAPMFMSSWSGRTGFTPALEMITAQTFAAARAFRVDDLNALGEYMRAVFANTQAFINNADDARLTSEIDMSIIGYGQMSFPVWFSAFIIGHVHDVMGEISALKGCLGVKGYPF